MSIWKMLEGPQKGVRGQRTHAMIVPGGALVKVSHTDDAKGTNSGLTTLAVALQFVPGTFKLNLIEKENTSFNDAKEAVYELAASETLTPDQIALVRGGQK